MRAVATRRFALRGRPVFDDVASCRAMRNGLLAARSSTRVERRVRFDQQSVTERARPASLVSLYLLFMSFAVWARAITVASKLTRCLDAISLLAIAKAVQALTAPNAHRSMHGTCTYPATGSHVMPRG